MLYMKDYVFFFKKNFKPLYLKSGKADLNSPIDTGRKLNVDKTFRRRPGRLLNMLSTFNLRPVSTGSGDHCFHILVLNSSYLEQGSGFVACYKVFAGKNNKDKLNFFFFELTLCKNKWRRLQKEYM